jgi:hypothetical protein
VKAPAEDREPTRRPAQKKPAPDRALAGAAQRLQATAGNRAVQRLVGSAPTKGSRAPASTDPKFAALTGDIRDKQKLLGKHPPAKAEAAAAAAAAKPPQDDKEAQGKTANAEKMNAAKPGEFDKAAFVRAVNEAIAAQAPKNLDEADKFATSGKAEAVKGQVQGQVSQGKQQSASQIESTTKAPPDTAAAKEKPVTPLTPDRPPPTPAAPNPANAVPDKAPPEATDFSAGPAQVNDQMATAQVTEQQLANANEPEFTGALAAKHEGEQHAATAPGQVRAKEAQTLAGTKAQAAQEGGAAMAALSATRRQAGAEVTQGKQGAQGSDEAKRAQVNAKLQTVFDATKKDVEGILTGLDKKVDEKFTTDEKAARDAFTAEHKRRMDAYKDQRYSGLLGAGRWIRDKFAGLPDEANQIFVQARQGYTNRMQQVISGVADLIGAELNRAKQRIADGRAQLQAEVSKLSPELQAIGKEAAAEFAGKFDSLTESVDAKGSELVNTLASRYNEALASVDEEIEAEKEKNKGLVAKAVDAVKGVIQTILQLKDMLLGVLAKAADAVMGILADPIKFLGNLVSAVGAGLHAFLANIGEHLKKGLLGWLLGALASAGIQLPAKFDLRGIIQLVGSLLGLTWSAIRGRIITRGVPAQAVDTVEQTVPVAQKLQSEGVGGIWEEIKEKVGDLKENLFSKISEYLIPTVLVAGITWIVSLLNPASAFIKACKMIIDIVTFIVQRGAQIIEFVSSVLDAVVAIARGGSGGVPALIEKALAKSIPVLIGALAAILGVGGIAEKVKKFFQSLSKPVMKAVDWVVDKLVKFGKKIWAKLKAKFGKDKKGKPGADQPATRSGEWAKRQIAGVNRDLPVTVEDETHHMKATGRPDGTLAVSMASAEEPLKAKVQRIITELQKSGAPPKVKVKTRDGRTKEISQGDVVQHLQRALRNEELLEKAVQKWAERMAALAQPPATAPSTLQQLIDEGLKKSVPPVAETPAGTVVIPKGFDHRKVLYEGDGGRFRSARSAVFARDYPAIYDRVQEILAPCRTAQKSSDAAALAAARATARAELHAMTIGDRPKLPKPALEQFDKTGDITGTLLRTSTLWNPDHIAPLSAHWHAIGYNSGDAQRIGAVDDLGNMELLAKSENLSKQGEYQGKKYDFHSKPPGPGFTTAKEIPTS